MDAEMATLAAPYRRDPRLSAALRPARVLIAEDDPELSRFLVQALFADGYRIEVVTNGIELLDRARCPEHELDLIISDIRMPGLTGLEVLARLRSPHRPGAWNIPVIFITAFGDEETHAEAERLGAVVFDKPFEMDDLRTCAINLVRPVIDPTRRARSWRPGYATKRVLPSDEFDDGED